MGSRQCPRQEKANAHTEFKGEFSWLQAVRGGTSLQHVRHAAVPRKCTFNHLFVLLADKLLFQIERTF